jgi:hypothetical protein
MFPMAALPNPSDSSFVAFGAAVGAFLGGTAARLFPYNADNKMRWGIEGSYYGTGVALCVYLAVNAHKAGAL